MNPQCEVIASGFPPSSAFLEHATGFWKTRIYPSRDWTRVRRIPREDCTKERKDRYAKNAITPGRWAICRATATRTGTDPGYIRCCYCDDFRCCRPSDVPWCPGTLSQIRTRIKKEKLWKRRKKKLREMKNITWISVKS